MSVPSVVIAGCGDVGSRLASQLLASEWEVHGLRRDISRLPDGVIGIAGGPEKCRWLTHDLGFDGAIDYKHEDVAAGLKALVELVDGDELEPRLGDLDHHRVRGVALGKDFHVDGDGAPAHRHHLGVEADHVPHPDRLLEDEGVHRHRHRQ